MAENPERWEVALTEEQRAMFGAKPGLLQLLTLARVVNALMFCFDAILRIEQDGSPATSRQTTNSVFFTAGVLYEGLLTAEEIREHFGDRESYREGLGKMLADPGIVRLRDKVLIRLRNQVAFHFDKKMAPKIWKEINLPTLRFAVGRGKTSGGMYYQLADEVAINYFINEVLGVKGSAGVELEAYKDHLRELRDTLTSFVHGADRLIGDVMSELGCTVREETSD